MNYVQVKKCDINKMGRKQGWCLNNVKAAYGITQSGTSAKVQLEAEKKAGRFHAEMAPKNVAVPVFLKTNSQYGHVMISYYGQIYSDGLKANISAKSIAGWSEGLCGQIIVKAEAVPAKKSNDQIADEVIAGKWGNGADRKKRLTDAGYDYGVIQDIVNRKVNGGGAPTPAPAALRAGDIVKITRWVDYYNRPLRQMSGTYKIMQLSGNRAVVTRNGGVYAAMNVGNLARA